MNQRTYHDTPESPVDDSPTVYIDHQIGKRYVRCRLDTFDCSGDEPQAKCNAVVQCRDYVDAFREHHEAGRSLILIGPKGTGKDHLVSAVVREIAKRLGKPGAVVFRDGLSLFAEVKATYDDHTRTDDVVEKYIRPVLLAISDPLPPVGALSQHDQSVILRIIDGRYRQCLPLAVTVNCSSRKEMAERLGPQATDRLFDCAVVVPCNWKSYRKVFETL